MPTQTPLTIAQALASNASNLMVQDTAANIVGALPNPAFIARVASFTVAGSAHLTGAQMSLLVPIASRLHAAAGALQLTGNSTLSVAQLNSFESLPGFAVAPGAALTVSDTQTQVVGAILNHLAWFMNVSAVTIQLDGSAMGAYPATVLENMIQHGRTVSFVPTPGHAMLNIDAAAHDLATNAASLNTLGTQQPLSIALANEGAVLSATDAASLLTLHGFSVGAHSLAVSDTGANVTSHLTALLGHGYGSITASSGIVSGTAAQLLDTTLHYAAGTHAQLSTSATVNAATANALVALPGFTVAGHALMVTDTAANLQTLTPASLAQITATQLGADTTVSAQAAQSLFAQPGFSTNGHAFTIADTAANLLALPHGVQVASTLLSLSGAQTVSAATLTQLAALGIKFSTAGHAITCADTAANLAALSPTATSLAGSEVIATSASVSAATAASLATLPNLSLATGATLSVQDSVANLITLGQGGPAIVSAERLPAGSVVTISAARAVALAGLPHFSPAGATITIADTIANLSAAGNATLASVGAVDVVDTAANLAAYAATPLLQNAAAVTLSGNGQVSAGAAAQIASIPHFGAGNYQLTVADTAANIAARAAAVLQVASSAIVTDSGPISTAVADQLATVSNAGILSFQGGDQLLVQDSYAALTNPGNSAGLILAARIGVLDSAANLAAAAAHDWGALNPSYTLSAGGTVSAATAMSLAGLGAHFSFGGYTLGVVDNASAIISAASALNALHLSAVVTDTAANLDVQAPSLLSLGNTLTAVYVSDTSPVSASVAAGLSGLTSLLAGPVVQVTDTAANVDAALGALTALGNHVAITVFDTAANIGAHATHLATLSNVLSVSPTDTVAVTAVVAAALAPLASELAPGTRLDVTDTVANITAHVPALSSLSADLGTVTLSDSTIVTAPQAASLATIDGHLAPGVMLTATGSAASIATNAAALTTLRADGHLAAVIVAGTTVLDATSHAVALNDLNAQVSITDDVDDVQTHLSDLAQITGLQSITLDDGGTPAVSISLATLASDAATLAKIVSPFTITVYDTAANLEADLALGQASVLAGNLQQIGTILASGGEPLTFSQAQILAPGVDDSASSILAKFSGPLDVTGVDVGDLAEVASLQHSPSSIAVADTAANIAADISLGSASALLSHLPQIASVTVTDGQSITLDTATALLANVDDGPGSVVASLNDATLAVTGASISSLDALTGLYIQPVSIAVSDTAAAITADLGASNSDLLALQPIISAISVSDGQTIILTESKVLTPGVDDGPASILAKVTGGSFAVENVAAGDVGELLGLYVVPVSLSINDTAAHIVSNLPELLSNLNRISDIDVVGAPLTLSADEALSAHVDDGPGSLLSLVNGQAFRITGASIAQLPALESLPIPALAIDISDSSSNIATDLLSGNPLLDDLWSSLGTVNVTHGTLTLTDTQAVAILASPFLNAVMDHLAPTTIVSVSGVPIADLTNIVESGWPHLAIGVGDTAANIIGDLGSNHSILQADADEIGSVSLDADATVSASDLTSLVQLPQFSKARFGLTVQDGVSAILALSPSSLAQADQVSVVDTGLNFTANIAQLQTEFAGNLQITLTDQNPPNLLSLNATTYTEFQPTIDAVTNPGVFGVLDGADAIAGLAETLAHDAEIRVVAVQDSANNVIADYDKLQVLGSKLTILLSNSQITANLVEPLVRLGNQLVTSGLPVVDAGSQIAAVVEAGDLPAICYLNTNGASLADSSPVTAADAAALESLTNFSKAGNALVVWDTVQHLTSTNLLPAVSSGLIDGVFLKTPGGAVTISAATALTLFGIPSFTIQNPFGTPNWVIVSDTAAQLEADLQTLTANSASIAGFVVNASATISDQTLSDLQGLRAVLGAGVTISVKDSGAVIAANANAQSSGHTLEPVSWALSGNSTLSEADALTLGGLTGFTAGPYTITLSLVGDLTISVADANKLGNIGGALNLGGHHLIVSGSVQQLSSLSMAALSFVTPNLVDTAANIAALPLTSPLLDGDVSVTGPDTLTAQTASSLLGLIRSGGGSGIAPGSLSFGATETVQDTVSNLRSLTGCAAWTSNPVADASFRLVAQDSVANLVNSANSGFLSGIEGTTLDGDVTISAGLASSLAAVTDAIHFDAGVNQITVQDSASNLVTAYEAGGLELANTVLLAGPARLDASDAAALLAIPHLDLTTSLTIADSSTNLLGGALFNAIAGSGLGSDIHVQLAGPETLDAQTAQALVSMRGFSDPQDLTIADDPSYLLNGAYLSAETMASRVTLSGNVLVSANTVYQLSELPNFTTGGSTLMLANNDFANAATLKAVADMGSDFNPAGHSLTMTSDALDLSPAEYTALQSDNVLRNGHALGVVPTGVSLSEPDNVLTGSDVSGSVIHLYGSDGSLVSSETPAGGTFAISAPGLGDGLNFSLTEITGSPSQEGAPLILLDNTSLEDAVISAGGSFASDGAIQVDDGKFINLYQEGAVPVLTTAALVYDPVAHAVDLDVPNQSPVVLLALGGSTHPSSLDASEIMVIDRR